MARKLLRKRASNEAKPPLKSATGRIMMNIPPGMTPEYVNHMEVGRSRHEFFVLGGRLPSKLSAEQIQRVQDSGEVQVEATMYFMVPTSMMPGLLRAVTAQLEAYEKEHGKIQETPAEKATKRGNGK